LRYLTAASIPQLFRTGIESDGYDKEVVGFVSVMDQGTSSVEQGYFTIFPKY
jgi:hypothetical protein